VSPSKGFAGNGSEADMTYIKDFSQQRLTIVPFQRHYPFRRQNPLAFGCELKVIGEM